MTNGADAIERSPTRPDCVCSTSRCRSWTGSPCWRRWTAFAPRVGFVSAHDQYAVRAFEAPPSIHPEAVRRGTRRTRAARVRGQLARPHGDRPIDPGWSHSSRSYATGVAPIAGRQTGGRVVFLRTEDIDWVEASGNYVRLHVAARRTAARKHENMERRLEPSTLSAFTARDRERRPHRELEPVPREYIVILRDGTR